MKRTALGRIKREAAFVADADGTAVVYSGDDQDGEYIYKFVAATPWQEAIDAGTSPLDDGTLYVARFNDDGTGEWLPLVFGQGPLTLNGGFADQADLLIRTREAADKVGATRLDRPEWIAENPLTGDIFVTLTNGTQGANPINPREDNPYGHIVRWTETDGDKTALTFDWDVFVLAGDPAYDPEANVNGDSFGSPDGLWVDPAGVMWIQTDISNSRQALAEDGYDNIGNNQMLAADPATGEIKRFIVGPRGCEVTGAFTTPDQTTMFVNIQHPGESTPAWGEATPEDPTAVSSWPDGEGRPRSATVAIRKDDGGVIGS
jgi:secreted PhoX family phosphatase